MKYYKKLILASVTVALLIAGCSDFLDINQDPNAATELKGDLLLPPVLTHMSANRSIEYGPDNAFFTQIWASNQSAGVFSDPEMYNTSTFTAGNAWGAYYTDILKNLDLMVSQAENQDPKRNNVVAQGKILSALAYYQLSMLFGDIPYSEANNLDIPQPKFDSQESILHSLADSLDKYVGMIDPASDLGGVEAGDLIYKGDMNQWIKFGNSLRFEILMFIRNKDQGVDSQIDALLGKALIESNADEAAIPFYDQATNANNIWRLNALFGGFADAGNGNNFLFGGETLVEMMKDKQDPRLSTYFEANDNGDYVGVPAGTFVDNASSISQNIIRKDWPNRIITASGILLLEAEYYATKGDMNTAQSKFEAGVQAGLDYFDNKPGAISQADKQQYVNNLPQLGNMSQSDAVKTVQEHEYIEIFDRAPENWANWKRTHVPSLPLPQEAVLGNIIRRYPYPPDEESANPNTPSRDSYTLDQPMWFEN